MGRSRLRLGLSWGRGPAASGRVPGEGLEALRRGRAPGWLPGWPLGWMCWALGTEPASPVHQPRRPQPPHRGHYLLWAVGLGRVGPLWETRRGPQAVSTWLAGTPRVAACAAVGPSASRTPVAASQRIQRQGLVLKGVLHAAEDSAELGAGLGAARAPRPSSKATLWVKAQHEGALPPPCIVRKDPRVPHTARRGA